MYLSMGKLREAGQCVFPYVR